jgi:hypothetical protein
MAREILSKRNFLDFESPDSAIYADGPFIVKLPFKASPANIGATREIATKRYFTLERKIHGNSVFEERYKEFMKEYEDLNHMVPVTELQAELGSVYLPHHGVIKESSTTTKLRVVFDASLNSSNGASLNDRNNLIDEYKYILISNYL